MYVAGGSIPEHSADFHVFLEVKVDLVLAFLSALLERRHSCLSRSPWEAVASARLLDVGTFLEHVETHL